jgi:hypothetical protein
VDYCDHPRMRSTARIDHCPDCGYEFYYGDVHSPIPEARLSREVNPGRSRPVPDPPQLSWPGGVIDDDLDE